MYLHSVSSHTSRVWVAATATPINYVTLDSLDTASWYAVRIRTVCEDEYYVPWADTLLIYIPGDTCWKPTWLHVAELDSAMVTLAWNAGETILWGVEMAEDGTELDSGVVMTVDDSSIQVEGLDTSQWYWARVRALCDSDYWSDWTDTIRFLVPNEHPSGPDTTNTINPVEQYTYLMPNPAKEEVTVMSSFRVKKVELFASDGKLLQTKEVNAVGTRLSLEGLPAGVYFVRVTTTAGVTTKRLVKTEN